MSGVAQIFTGAPKPKKQQPQVQQGPSAEEIRAEADAQEKSRGELARIRASKAKKGSRQASILNSPSGDTSDAPVLKKTLG